MILKFILLGTICWNFPDVGTQCSQYMDMNVPDAATCKERALMTGRKHKAEIEE